jgi:hypothetical protein
MNEPINLTQKLALFDERFSPRIVTTMNDYKIEVVKVEGDFVWHSHLDTDEFFLVLAGELEIELRDRMVRLRQLGVLRGQPLPSQSAPECAAVDLAAARPHPHRRGRRAEDASHGGGVRRRLEPHRWSGRAEI